jgi:hypothetical protein
MGAGLPPHAAACAAEEAEAKNEGPNRSLPYLHCVMAGPMSADNGLGLLSRHVT